MLLVEKLRRDHALDDFDCGTPALNKFLIEHSWQSQRANASQTYLAIESARVIGFYTLAVGQVEHHAAPARLAKGLARHPIPIMVLARLAVARTMQNRGLGAGLLKDAIIRTLQAADIAGIRAMTVSAKSEEAAAFYAKWRFAPSLGVPLELYVLIKDLKSLIG